MAFTDVLKKAFPFISAAASLGGPLGTMAASVVGGALGLTKAPPNSADAISSAITAAFANPEQRAALLKAEHDFQLQMVELGYKDAEELEATAAADRASARNREIQVKDSTPKIIAAVVILMAGIAETYTAWAIFHGKSFGPEGAVIIGRILGMLDSAVALVLAYYFGSSAGSAAKTQVLNDIASQK